MTAKHGEFRELIRSMFQERHKQPHLTVSLLRQHWGDILGDSLARKTYPARMAGHILWINALDASWAYQLQFMKHELLESVQVFMGSEDITELRFRQGEPHATVDEDEAATPHGQQEQTPEDSGESGGNGGNGPAHNAGAAAENRAGNRTKNRAESGKHAAEDSSPSGDVPDADHVADSVTDSAMDSMAESMAESAIDSMKEPVVDSAAVHAIHDDSLRDSFSRWAHLKKRKKPSKPGRP